MIKVSTRSTSKWSSTTSFHLGVSMGSGHHQGAALEAMVDWINAQGFERGLIDISDTLNRFNYMIAGVSEKEAFEITKREGVKWEIQNMDILRKLKMPVEIVHWSHWLADDRFKPYLHAFEMAVERNLNFKIAMMSDIARHYLRRYNQNIHERSAADIALSQKYYLEELAVLSIQFEDFPCVEIYPGKELECVRAVRNGKVANVPRGLKQAIYTPLFLHEEHEELQTV